MNFITIMTSNYALNAQRLVRSLKRHHPECTITVFSDDVTLKPFFAILGARLELLPEIATMGVKRAKFTAYSRAARKGSFIYLDADIIIVKPLIALIAVDCFTACRDDLRECSFISDPMRPWSSSPQLSGENYFNSGVFAVPSGFFEFFSEIEQAACDNNEWLRYVVPGKLYDNHFLCAKIAQYQIPVKFISEYEYNWQGFRNFGELNCYLDDELNLRNQQGGMLRLVHFAGVRDIDAYVSSLPLDIVRVLSQQVGGAETGSLEVITTALNLRSGLEDRLKLIMARSMCHPPAENITRPGAELSVLTEPESVASIALSVQESDFLWNGLKCGSAYFTAAEYQKLRDFVVKANVAAVLEFGAGYTTVLFADLVSKQVALEGWDGPWLEYARSRGADARLVPFSGETGFDETAIIEGYNILCSIAGKRMIFIDSPQGTANRARVVEQIVSHAQNADFYVVHDSIRDSSIVYRLSSALRLQVIEHFPSLRGLTILGKDGFILSTKPQIEQSLRDRAAQMRFKVDVLERLSDASGRLQKFFVHLENIGEVTLAASSDGLEFSMHLLGGLDEIVQWDTPRYTLPVDLSPTDHVSFWVEVPSCTTDVAWVFFDFVKEGEFWWSDITSNPCPRLAIA
ncbi:hypothetical protein MJO47_10740 [Desulfuromonas sp. KJ2020]|uniref:hypothetical protein n=1 Tax=Desulfuromonas sp. KJ2020 TaxID=2919173 RepID=UPI0020A75991|nr:hypothetical protein [Desulfuromonas sp. KJ2020]MCP3177578.1 hypothetical protein [Desulfuromonas sp. KJ2020]